jgi:hypothetical protein
MRCGETTYDERRRERERERRMKRVPTEFIILNIKHENICRTRTLSAQDDLNTVYTFLDLSRNQFIFHVYING